jgi:hypothetical protein
MKRAAIITVVITAIIMLFVGTIAVRLLLRSPKGLVNSLRSAAGPEREKILMRIGLTTEDIVPALISALDDASAAPEFRGIIVDLMFRKYSRNRDDRIMVSLHEALSDKDPLVRRTVVEGFATYLDAGERLAVLDRIADSDPGVRKVVYELLVADGGSVWDKLDEAQRTRIVETAAQCAATEPDEDLTFLAHSVLGRQIEDLCNEAVQAFQKSDVVGMEDLLSRALALDPENLQARIRMVRMLLKTGEREKALKLAETYGALMKIPRLSSAPEIDGDPSDEAWKNAFAGDIPYRTNARWATRLTQSKSRFYAGYYEQTLYIGVLAYEDDLSKLIMQKMNRDDGTWKDDCVELFFDPFNSEMDVYQFVINARGVLFDSYQNNNRSNFECEHAAGVFKDRGYWACEFAIKVSEMGGHTITADSIWGIDVMRTRIGPASEQCAWWPTFGSSLKFHLHPLAVFENAPPVTNTVDADGAAE